MAVYFANTPTNGDLVAGAAGRIIRVRRVIFTCDQNGYFELRHSYGTGGEMPIVPRLYVRSAGQSPLDLRFDREAPQTPPGAPLGFFTELVSNFSIWIEYELVA